MLGQRVSSSPLLLVLVAMVSSMLLLPHPVASSPAPAPAAASANIIHHEGGGGDKGGGEGSNPANKLVAAVNANRTAAGLPPLRNSKGLGCMALQYISRCIVTTGCSDTGALAAACHPPETDITEVYAANCGVELPTVDLITGRLLGCTHDDDPNDAVLFLGANSTAAVRGKEHTQVGAGILRQRRHGPYFWCLLFSGGSPGSRPPAGASPRESKAASATRRTTPSPPATALDDGSSCPWLCLLLCFSSSCCS